MCTAAFIVSWTWTPILQDTLLSVGHSLLPEDETCIGWKVVSRVWVMRTSLLNWNVEEFRGDPENCSLEKSRGGEEHSQVSGCHQEQSEDCGIQGMIQDRRKHSHRIKTFSYGVGSALQKGTRLKYQAVEVSLCTCQPFSLCTKKEHRRCLRDFYRSWSSGHS